MTKTRTGVSAETLASISTPDHIDTRLGLLDFVDGAPSEATAELLYDHWAFINGVKAFVDGFPGASLVGIRRGFRSIGVEDNSLLLFSELMDSASVFLTANTDTVYALGFLDLSDGPMIVDVPSIPAPSGFLGTVDDMWFRWITDMGLPGPDRGHGGRYLLVGPEFEGTLPDGGFFVSHSRTNRVILLLRAFMIDNDPSAALDAIHNRLRISHYTPGGMGTAVATFLAGDSPLAGPAPAEETIIVEGSHVSFNTVPPSDWSYWEVLKELIDDEPVGSGDPELLGMLAAVGISKGKEFAPDPRMRRILEQAVAVGNATARTITFAPRDDEEFSYYPGSRWINMLFKGGYDFLTPPPEITPDGVVAYEGDGARKIDSRIAFFYPATGVTPAMCMRLTGIGSQYLIATRDANGEFFDGARDYRITLPADIPQSRFWSVILYDRQTRSMLQTDQPHPSIGSQTGTVKANDDGSTTIHIGPTAPEGAETNWLQSIPGKGYFVTLRLYNPLQSFFDKSWRPSEIQPV